MENVKEWIEEWCDLWPSDVEWNNSKIKSSVTDCVKRMQNFCKRVPIYTKSTIFAATELYLEQREDDNWQFTKRSMYFIEKRGEASLLESYCNKVIESEVVVDAPSKKDITNFNSDWI